MEYLCDELNITKHMKDPGVTQGRRDYEINMVAQYHWCLKHSFYFFLTVQLSLYEDLFLKLF